MLFKTLACARFLRIADALQKPSFQTCCANTRESLALKHDVVIDPNISILIFRKTDNAAMIFALY